MRMPLANKQCDSNSSIAGVDLSSPESTLFVRYRVLVRYRLRDNPPSGEEYRWKWRHSHRSIRLLTIITMRRLTTTRLRIIIIRPSITTLLANTTRPRSTRPQLMNIVRLPTNTQRPHAIILTNNARHPRWKGDPTVWGGSGLAAATAVQALGRPFRHAARFRPCAARTAITVLSSNRPLARRAAIVS